MLFNRKKAFNAEQPEKPESLGLYLAIRFPGGSAVELKLSEQTAAKLAPGLAIALIATLGITGLWLGVNYLPRQLAISSQPAAETQPQKRQLAISSQPIAEIQPQKTQK